MPNLLPANEAQALTAPLHSVFLEAHTVSMSRWCHFMKTCPDFARPLDPAQKYALLHKNIASHVADNIGDTARFYDGLRFAAVLLEDKALIRFKHFDSAFRPRSYPTNQQRHLGSQQFTEPMM